MKPTSMNGTTNELSEKELGSISGGQDYYLVTYNPTTGTGKLEFCSTGTFSNGVNYTVCKML
jgi:hypothetical protein